MQVRRCRGSALQRRQVVAFPDFQSILKVALQKSISNRSSTETNVTNLSAVCTSGKKHEVCFEDDSVRLSSCFSIQFCIVHKDWWIRFRPSRRERFERRRTFRFGIQNWRATLHQVRQTNEYKKTKSHAHQCNFLLHLSLRITIFFSKNIAVRQIRCATDSGRNLRAFCWWSRGAVAPSHGTARAPRSS